MKFINKDNTVQEEYGCTEIPENCIIIPDEFDMSIFYQYNGFVTFEVDEETRTATKIIPDINAYEAWRTSIPKGGYEPAIQERLDGLKAELEASDYKVTKCMEYKLLGRELPYDIAALSSRRDAIRKQIDILQDQLAKENT